MKKLLGSVFIINQHYLLSTYKLIERLGPMPHYAAFCIERAIGELKRRVHSVRDAGVNSGNVAVEIVAIRRRNRLQQPEEKKKTIVVSTLPNSPKLWGPFSQKSASDMKCAAQLKNF